MITYLCLLPATSLNFYPPEIENNTYFNHSNIIKEDMATFLAVYAASIKISSNKNSRIWMNAANKTFNEIEGKDRKRQLELLNTS